MADIFEIIKSIQKTDRSILPHAEKNLLVSIAIHIGNGDHIWPNNEQLGKRIGENKDYVKNLLARLKKKGFIDMIGRGKSRTIKIVGGKIFGNSQLPNHSVGNSQLPVGNSQLPNPATPIKRKEKKNQKEKSAASPDSFYIKHPKLDEILKRIPFRVRKDSINTCLLNQGEPYINYLLRVSEGAENPEWYFKGGVLGYYRDYLNSPEYAIAGWKLENTNQPYFPIK